MLFYKMLRKLQGAEWAITFLNITSWLTTTFSISLIKSKIKCCRVGRMSIIWIKKSENMNSIHLYKSSSLYNQKIIDVEFHFNAKFKFYATLTWVVKGSSQTKSLTSKTSFTSHFLNFNSLFKRNEELHKICAISLSNSENMPEKL